MDRLDFAIKLSRQVGFYLLQYWGRAENVREKSSFQDLVTDCDKQAQKMIVDQIRKNFPEDSILAEEGLFEDGDKLWIIDPIDGTMNFVHGLPSFGVGIAYVEKGNVVLGVAHDPVLNETFYCVQNQGAYKNGERIKVSSNDKLKDCIGNVGFYIDFTGKFLSLMEKRVRRMRIMGSAILAGAYVACGRFDFFVARRANPWDVAPVLLMVKEAGGMVTDIWGNEATLSSKSFVFSNKAIHEELLKVIQEADR
ncbi:inositol monophosphatase family protein [Pseudothermotoga thermarum]|uniref:Inositol-1-monophosphatase n=1 Tax=Pseudothermotoga thermarum DSM 5069 TaxID=688269 RepID=F7YWC0_9THEM|nr:inositol monophosphatase family protein [Pseudothermotoga thermarum]AEH51898.1 inositol monophosphatase [Pseudothermotoga thermarum DSM 5069]